jgi:hypothetical protein
MKKKITKSNLNEGVYVKMIAGKDEILNLRLNDFENGEQVNETLNGMIKIISAAIIGSALTILSANEITASSETLPALAEKLISKFNEDSKEFMMTSINETMNKLRKKKDETPSDFNGKA